MARKTISELTGLFETGDTPGGADFASIFDSNFNLQETGTSVASGSLNVLTDVTASKFKGDGSALTNLPASSTFPFTGDAVITGSLLISGSQVFVMDNDNVILGANAGGGGINPPTDTANIIIGPSAAGGGGLNNGSRNIAIGSGSGFNFTTGDDMVAIGTEALHKAADDTKHIGIGYRALYNHDSGNNNIAIGERAFYDSSGVGSSGNTVIGNTAGYAGVRSYNIAIGEQAMCASTGADYNVCIGYLAGKTLDGDDNIMIGNQAGELATTGDNNIIIGNEVEKSAADASNEIKIGDSSIVPFSASLATGDVLFPSTASAAYFVGNGSQLTNLPAASPFPLSGSAIISSSFTSGDTNSHVLQLIGSGSVSGSGLFEIEGSVGTLFSAIDSLSGSLMSVTDASGIPILEVFSDATVEAKGFKGYRPIETRAASFVLQLSDMGTYNRCGGVAITASLSASSAIPFAIGTEIEFVQTSSAGNLLITASAGSGITLNSKNGNLKLAGQFSAATLKKVGTNEWDLIGDLT